MSKVDAEISYAQIGQVGNIQIMIAESRPKLVRLPAQAVVISCSPNSKSMLCGEFTQM